MTSLGHYVNCNSCDVFRFHTVKTPHPKFKVSTKERSIQNRTAVAVLGTVSSFRGRRDYSLVKGLYVQGR